MQRNWVTAYSLRPPAGPRFAAPDPAVLVLQEALGRDPSIGKLWAGLPKLGQIGGTSGRG
jgi:hypothetical protein